MKNIHFVCKDYNVYCFGITIPGIRDYNEFQLIPYLISTPTKIRTIHYTEQHELYLDINGRVYSHGNNKCGQLEVGDYEYRHDITIIPIYMILLILKLQILVILS